LQTLESALRTGLQQAGIALDPRPYQPHLTLFRKVNQLPRDLPEPDFDWPISDFRLVESLTHPEGVRYQSLQSWPLIG
jgi:2'-5' RNA ligase